MWWNKKRKLQRLSDELRGIALLDRLYADRTDLTLDDHYAHAMRQTRQTELLREVERLTNKKRLRMSEEQKPARSRHEISAAATPEQDYVSLIERLEKLKRALDERDGKVGRAQKFPSAA